MKSLNHVENYANAMFSIWEECNDKRNFQWIAKEVYLSLKENMGIIDIFSSNNLSKKERKNIVNKIYGSLPKGEIPNIFKNFLYVLIDNESFELVLHIFVAMFEKIDNHNNFLFLRIYSPYELDEEFLSRIKKIFSKKTSKRIIYSHFVDKSLIGGIKILFNDVVYDYSIKGKIEDVKWKLINKNGA